MAHLACFHHRHTSIRIYAFTKFADQQCHVLNSSGALLILTTHVANQVVYCHYMLTPFMECLWYVKFWHLCLKQEDKLKEWEAKGQVIVVRINLLWYNRFVFYIWIAIFLRKTGPIHLALVGLTAGWQTKCRCKFKILYWLNYSDFYYV